MFLNLKTWPSLLAEAWTLLDMVKRITNLAKTSWQKLKIKTLLRLKKMNLTCKKSRRFTCESSKKRKRRMHLVCRTTFSMSLVMERCTLNSTCIKVGKYRRMATMQASHSCKCKTVCNLKTLRLWKRELSRIKPWRTMSQYWKKTVKISLRWPVSLNVQSTIQELTSLRLLTTWK